MMSKVLVTTALEQTWPNRGSICFLGSWCFLSSREKYIKTLDYSLVPYHWDDRSKLCKDFGIVNRLYEKTLQILSEELNKKHRTNFSLRYWRILIGPWLGYFTAILYDRWCSLESVFLTEKIESVIIKERDPNSLIPIDMDEFNRLIIDDEWNEMIFGEIIYSVYSKKIEIEKLRESKFEFEKNNHPHKQQSKVRSLIENLISKITGSLVFSNEYFFKSTSFSFKTLVLAQCKLGFLPKFWRSKKLPCSIKRPINRAWCTNGPSDNFETFLCRMAIRHIPAIYYENFVSAREYVQKLPWPSQPQAIFTHVAWESDDIFKLYAAEKTALGYPLVIGQHGGFYGSGRFSFIEKHEVEISDKYLTWGWNESAHSHLKESVAPKPWSKKINYNKDGLLMLVLVALPRYSTYLWSAPLGGQWLKYRDDQYKFLAGLSESMRQKTVLRGYRHEYGWDLIDAIKREFPDIILTDTSQNITESIDKCRIIVCTYNATTYLETLMSNIPTIVFWEPQHWEIRDNVADYFNELIKVGLLHYSAESAAAHACKIWDHVEAWWSSAAVQQAREMFCQKFARSSPCLVDKIISDIR